MRLSWVCGAAVFAWVRLVGRILPSVWGLLGSGYMVETTPSFLLPVLLSPTLTTLPLPPSIPHPNKPRAELELWGRSVWTAGAPGDSLVCVYTFMCISVCSACLCDQDYVSVALSTCALVSIIVQTCV